MIPKIVFFSAFLLLFLHYNESVPFQRCLLQPECGNFCNTYGYNRSECTSRALRLSRFCECYDCDFVLCATYCTKQNLKFVGCSCFSLPTVVAPQTAASSSAVDPNQLLGNECADGKFFCQCSK